MVVRTGLALGVAALLLVGCASDDDGSATTGTESSSTESGGTESADNEGTPGDDSSIDAPEEDTVILEPNSDTDTGEPSEDAIDDAGDATDAGPDTPDEDTVGEDTVQPEPEPEPEPIPEPEVEADFGNCSEPGGARNIYDIQDPQCPDHVSPAPTGPPGFYVKFENVVVTASFGDTFFVQEQNGGPYSGMAVFSGGAHPDDLVPGDVINIEGSFSEFYGATQLYMEEMQQLGTLEPPEPFEIVHPSHIATQGAIAELFEGVLVRVSDLKIIDTEPDCPQAYGEFMVTGDLRIDDMGYQWPSSLGDTFESITGPVHYTFNNFKVEPRNEDDFVPLEIGDEIAKTKCIAETCFVEEDDLGSQSVVITEVMFDPWGSDLGQEWFELYNPGSEPVDIYGWEIRDCGDQGITISGPDLVIEPGEYFVLGASTNTATNGGAAVDLGYGDTFYMPNTLGSILLYDGNQVTSNLVDQIRYQIFEEWEDVVQPGRSLERKNPTGPGADAQNWKASSKTYGPAENYGTPGE